MCIEEPLNRMVKASSMLQCGHDVIWKEDENVIVKALKFEVRGSRGSKRPKKQTDEEKWTGERGCI